MLVSVVLPVFNGSVYIEDAIRSILNQDVELELIVSNDGSTDNTLDIIHGIFDKRIKCISSNLNVGQFSNLNKGLAACEGDYIQIFSHDDIMRDGYLMSQVHHLKKYKQAGLVYGLPIYIDEIGTEIPSSQPDNTPEFVDKSTYIWISSHYGSLPPSISSVMLTRKALRDVGFFNENFKVAGDLEYYNRLSDRFAIIFNRERLHLVRSHPNAVSQLSTTGARYLNEELMLEEWFKLKWSKKQYEEIRHFRSAMRGRYHLGWIRRQLIAKGLFYDAGAALAKLNRIYPLSSILRWLFIQTLRPHFRPLPTIPPPTPVGSGRTIQ